MRGIDTPHRVQLKNPDLFHNQSYVNGEWTNSKSGATFEVVGESQFRVLSTPSLRVIIPKADFLDASLRIHFRFQ